MTFKHIAVSILLAPALITTVAQADNRSATESLFAEPATNGGSQVLLGFAELMAAKKVLPGDTLAQKMVAKANFDLKKAQELPLSETQRTETIKAIRANSANYEFGVKTKYENTLNESALRRIEALQSTKIVTEAEKLAAIQVAEVAVSTSRANVIVAMQEVGMIEKSLRVARYGTALVLVGDVGARIWIWNAMDANPTLSPAATYLKSLTQ